MSTDLRTLSINEVKFIYFRKNGGTITVAYTVLNRKDRHGVFRVIFDYSSCSPKDRFDKKIGRNMAFGRLSKRMKNLNAYDYLEGYSDLEFDDNPNQGIYKQAVENIERHLFYSGDFVIPQWYTKKAVTLPNFDNPNVSLAARGIANLGKLNKKEAESLKRLIDSKTYNFI
jgi:hypothetical protein